MQRSKSLGTNSLIGCIATPIHTYASHDVSPLHLWRLANFEKVPRCAKRLPHPGPTVISVNCNCLSTCSRFSKEAELGAAQVAKSGLLTSRQPKLESTLADDHTGSDAGCLDTQRSWAGPTRLNCE